MSSLKVGLVTSCGTESDLLIKLLESEGVELIYNISPSEILTTHAEAENLNVWLLNVDDGSWHDAIDHLLDESEVPVYFSEPGVLEKQSHPEFWCKNLLERLFEITGLERPVEVLSETEDSSAKTEVDIDTVSDGVALDETDNSLTSSLDELEISTVGLPSDIAAELVIELESLSPVLAPEESLDSHEATVDDVEVQPTTKNLDETADLEISEPEIDEPDAVELDTSKSDEIEMVEFDTLELESSELDSFELDELEVKSNLVSNSEVEPEIELMSFDSDDGSSQSIDEFSDEGCEIQLIDDALESEGSDIPQLISEPDLVEVETLELNNEPDELQSELSFETDELDFNLDLDSEEGADLTEVQELEEENIELAATLELEEKEQNISTSGKNKGRANFLVDEVETKEENSDKQKTTGTAPDLLSELSLVAIEEDNNVKPADWLNVESPEDSNSAVVDDVQNESFVVDDDLSLDEDAVSFENADNPDETIIGDSSAIDNDHVEIDAGPFEDTDDFESVVLPNDNHETKIDNEIEEFDIPMLDETASEIDFEEKVPVAPTAKLTPCWVIGASLGGPAAVKRFMQCIPKDINASFVVAQHIDESFLLVLAEILTNNSQFDVTVAKGSHEMSAGEIVIAPLKGKIDFLTDGSLLIDHSQKWSAPYSPCIDDVIKSVSQAYGDLAGAIIFSGMGEDGLNGAKKMHERGGLVWAQSPQTCANSSMPEAVINENLTDFVGTPEELAERLVAHLSE